MIKKLTPSLIQTLETAPSGQSSQICEAALSVCILLRLTNAELITGWSLKIDSRQ